MALTNDPMQLAWADMSHAVKLVREGYTRLVFIGGAPGIGKSRQVIEDLRSYVQQEEALWAMIADENKRELAGRRTAITVEGQLVFVPPVHIIPGGDRNEINLYMHLYQCSYPGEIGVLDDAPAAAYKRPQELLNDACDEERNGKVSMDRGHKILAACGVPTEYNFHGGLILIHNYTQAEINHIFHQRVRSRAYIVNFPTDPAILFRYVYETGIKQKSLLPYLKALNNRALGRNRGLGLSDAEAQQCLNDLDKFYFTFQERVPEHSFRLLRTIAMDWATDRVHWERRAKNRFRIR